MELNEYQRKAINTAVFPVELGIIYTALGLTNESGEVAGKIKKMIRDNNNTMNEEIRVALADELGDVLWYLSVLAHELGLTLDYVAARNVEKLASRKERGVIQGSGDNR